MVLFKKCLTLHPIRKRQGSESWTAYKTTDKSVKNWVKKRGSGKSHDFAEPILSIARVLLCAPKDVLILPLVLAFWKSILSNCEVPTNCLMLCALAQDTGRLTTMGVKIYEKGGWRGVECLFLAELEVSRPMTGGGVVWWSPWTEEESCRENGPKTPRWGHRVVTGSWGKEGLPL